MNDEEEMVRRDCQKTQTFSELVDFKKVIADGFLTRKGAYYVLDFEVLPLFKLNTQMRDYL